MGGMNGGVAGLACVWLLGLPGRVEVKQRELGINRAVHMAMQHLPRPRDGRVVKQKGTTELERGIGVPDAED